MRIYTFHMIPGATPLGEAVAVKEGFSWLAFLFGLLWLLYHRLWLWALVVFGLWLGLGLIAYWGLVDQLTLTIVEIGIKVWIGFSANDWRRDKLESEGHLLAGIVAGRDREAVDQRFYDGIGAQRAVSQARPLPAGQ